MVITSNSVIMNRRDLLRSSAALALSAALPDTLQAQNNASKTNLVFVFADQFRAQAAGYAGDPNVLTPHLDRLAAESVNFSHAVSCCPVCSPFRASLMTGQYPLTHGVFLNDLRLNNRAVSFAQAFNRVGYETAYIGKWHLDGTGRMDYIPPERRQDFKSWQALECTHNYNHSAYYEGNDRTKKYWSRYDAYSQTEAAISYLNQRRQDNRPFALFLSWGPPHAPYRTGPKDLLAKYDQMELTLRKNVPGEHIKKTVRNHAGYYAHIAALDECIGRLTQTLKMNGQDKNTVFVFTSDHGEMLYSHGQLKKQQPWDESIRIPFLVRCPERQKVKPRTIDMPINAPDFMPTVLSLCEIPIPATAEGDNFTPIIAGRKDHADNPLLIMCPSPFGQWHRGRGGREYRGIRTRRYTYVHDLNGPWLLFDNETDPYQMNNLIGKPEAAGLQKEMDEMLQGRLKQTGDEFLPGPELIRRCGYKVDENETIGYLDPAHHGQVSVSCRKG